MMLEADWPRLAQIQMPLALAETQSKPDVAQLQHESRFRMAGRFGSPWVERLQALGAEAGFKN